MTSTVPMAERDRFEASKGAFDAARECGAVPVVAT